MTLMRIAGCGVRSALEPSRDREGATKRLASPRGRSLTVAAQRSRSSRSGFTLVELLVAIAIIAILATLLLGVAARAGETAREARTKQLIARIHTLIMERFESYKTRRVELGSLDLDSDGVRNVEDPDTLFLLGGVDLSDVPPRQHIAAGRLAAVRELMKMEMPDRWSDLLLQSVATLPTDPNQPPTAGPMFVVRRTALNNLYLRRFQAVRGKPIDQILRNQSAECLYLTVMNATADGEAPSLFKEQDIGDTDEDGAPEFVDGWGNPIGWMRWAPGFRSDAQLNDIELKRVFDTQLGTNVAYAGADGVRRAMLEDHDPLDLFRVDRTPDDRVSDGFADAQWPNERGAPARGWRLLPLVCSAGADEEYGLVGLRLADNDGANDYLALANPWPDDVDTSTPEHEHLGQPDPDNDEDYVDNITNHLITAR